MSLSILVLIALVSLLGTYALTSFTSAIRNLHRKESLKELDQIGKLFFYRSLHKRALPKHEVEGILFSILIARILTLFLYMGSLTLLFFQFGSFSFLMQIFQALLLVLIGAFFIGEFFPRVIANRFPKLSLKLAAPIASIVLLFTFPISLFLLKLFGKHCLMVAYDYMHEPQAKGKREILDIIRSADIDVGVDPADKELIQSVVHFRERVAREVMVPRVDVFSLSSDTSIKEAAHLLEDEGYSRIPIYEDTVDQMVGVLMYKDLLQQYMEYEEKANDEQILSAPIKSIMKQILYTPETKKISHLLQDFRKKQVHLAIVVDEYGGTEGIVTIEDILEEIVGEIEDEYDEETALIIPLKDGSWIVDAKLNLIDLEEEIGLKFPQDGDYDTVGGYIYHRSGAIPEKGFVILQENSKLVVLKSNDRAVEKVRIVPSTNKKQEEAS